jgi:HlyD family secretion protein
MKELLEGLRIDRDSHTPARATRLSRRARDPRSLLVVAGVAAAAATASGYVVTTRPALVDTFTVLAGPAGTSTAPALTAGGYVRDPKVVYVAPKVAGRLVSLSVREGDLVGAGDVIALIDSRDLDQETAEARANYELASAALRKL